MFVWTAAKVSHNIIMRGANMKITKKWLEQNGACEEGKRWFISQRSTQIETIIKKLVIQARFGWANWAITKSMTHEQNVRYACFSALQSIGNFEKHFPASYNFDEITRRVFEEQK